MKLGFFTQPVHPPSRRYADVLREDREAVVLADRLGYREAFIGEHLADSAETIPSSLAFISMELMAHEVLPRVNESAGG